MTPLATILNAPKLAEAIINKLSMNIEILRAYVIEKPFVTEGFPFGDTVIVFKVKDKVFLLVPLDSLPLQFNVKCDPEKAIDLREQYPAAVLPGYHMNKKHWNTIIVDGVLSKKQLFEMVDHSYQLVLKGKK
jgi:predicted DNA-binding protein (MmcQ/YjbR family)